jgi:hypothetical protein
VMARKSDAAMVAALKKALQPALAPLVARVSKLERAVARWECRHRKIGFQSTDVRGDREIQGEEPDQEFPDEFGRGR